MDTKYFGTDGMRGLANKHPMTADVILRIGQAAAQVFAERIPHRPSVVIGKDTRLSGYMFESALQAGFTSLGFYTLLVGPLPTPAVAMLTRTLRADLGIMITASHNPYHDNGVKIFTPNGAKICEEKVRRIEYLVDHPTELTLQQQDKIGRAVRLEDAVGRYIEYCKTTLPRDFSLHGLRLVVDCANGAAYRIAPKIFWELGAQVIRLGVNPDGLNINKNCGATAPEALCKAVEQHGADAGIALDGDGDRLIMCDEKGRVIDGDQLIAAAALYLHQQKTLHGGGVVGTVMSNMGMEHRLGQAGLQLLRTKVGDHYVEAAMRERGFNLGGESSGHIIFKDYATTGDGILAALQILNVMRQTGQRASQIGQTFKPWPMQLTNIRLSDGADAAAVLDHPQVSKAIADATAALADNGRVLVRKSGTEPLIRVMVEAKTPELLETHLTLLCRVVNAQLPS